MWIAISMDAQVPCIKWHTCTSKHTVGLLPLRTPYLKNSTGVYWKIYGYKWTCVVQTMLFKGQLHVKECLHHQCWLKSLGGIYISCPAWRECGWWRWWWWWQNIHWHLWSNRPYIKCFMYSIQYNPHIAYISSSFNRGGHEWLISQRRG